MSNLEGVMVKKEKEGKRALSLKERLSESIQTLEKRKHRELKL